MLQASRKDVNVPGFDPLDCRVHSAGVARLLMTRRRDAYTNMLSGWRGGNCGNGWWNMVERLERGGRVRSTVRGRVSVVLDQLRPLIRGDGGDVELLDVDEDGVVKVRLSGACVGCPSSAITLSHGIERALREQVPEVSRVECA